MKWLLLLIVLTQSGWGLRIISEYEAVIVNNLSQSITCYIYYSDGDFEKRRVRPRSESRPFYRDNIVEVDCY